MRALVQEGIKNIEAGASPILIKRGMDKAIEAVVNEINNKMAVAIKGKDDSKKIATAAASGNEDIGEIIAEALSRGSVVTIEEGKSTETILEMVEGMQFDRGYISPYFVTNAEQLTVEMTHPYILLIEKKVSSIQELLPILEVIASSGAELLIIAEDIDSDALATLVVNRLRGTLKVACAKAPGFGDRRKAMLQDIAVLTKATVISEDTGMLLKDATLDLLGSAEKVTLTKDHTTIVNGGGDAKEIKSRILQIEKELEATTSSYDKEKLEERKAKLSGGVAVIRVGAATEPEMKQKKQMMEDSLNSTKAANASGVVIGGGVALLRASEAIDALGLTGEEALGGAIVKKCCEAPLRQIVTNTGIDGSVVLAEVRQAKPQMGFNAMTRQVEDLKKAGILDPAKVVTSLLQHAGSSASVILLSEALIIDAPEEEEEEAEEA
jgi:chaperonin GroEL